MVFHNTSRYCYEWLDKQPSVKEESLTDWLLYNVSNLSPKVYYKAFTRNEESNNGADWEWWILVNSNFETRAYRLLIQAKKLKPNSDNYPLVTYSNKNGMQIDLLIDEAKRRKALPLYAYYSCCKPDLSQQLINVTYIPNDLLSWCGGCTNGCLLTSAFELHSKVFSHSRMVLNEKELINSSFGLSILDAVLDNSMNPFNLLDKLARHYQYSVGNQESYNSGIVYKYKDLPQYVKTLIERNAKEDLSWFENEFRYYLDPLSGVVVIDAREL